MKKILICAVAGCIIFTHALAAATQIDLGRLAKKKGPLAVWIVSVTNEAGKSEVSADDFRKSLEDVIVKRGRGKSFLLSASPEASDVQISAVIRGYEYSEKDPITTFGSPSGLLLDAVTTENYVAMKAEFIVKETKTGKTLWDDSVTSFIKKMMTQQASVPLIYNKLARTFLWKCFGRPK
ncbi:MAG: hypothetical protein JW919_03830 [Candidatus Omnitrophica bacterium]|nr:hypothetical protein [Candidatus Omnitrophota bacterium]